MKITAATFALIASTATASAYDYRTDYNSPKIYAPDGQFLGNLNSNQFDPNSVSNPYGQYGSRYSPNSINNPYGQYGNTFSPGYVRPFGIRR